MQITATINASELEAAVERRIEGLPHRLMAAMAEQCRDIVMSNFGPTGVDRPYPWAPLSNRAPYFYAQQVGRPFATLYETGAMAGAVRTTNELDHSRVSLSDSDCPYATKHHFGDFSHNLPIRRVFPLTMDDQVTEYTKDAVLAAAIMELEAALR